MAVLLTLPAYHVKAMYDWKVHTHSDGMKSLTRDYIDILFDVNNTSDR